LDGSPFIGIGNTSHYGRVTFRNLMNLHLFDGVVKRLSMIKFFKTFINGYTLLALMYGRGCFYLGIFFGLLDLKELDVSSIFFSLEQLGHPGLEPKISHVSKSSDI